MVSGECEERFDDALRVNLDGGRHIFEAARAITGTPRVVFSSSIACFGGEAKQNPNTDRTKLTPQTTYGMTKAICELLVNDHSRKGHFDGRSARLPTVIIRPGKPNAAASSWASGMFREPLNGEPCLLPVRRDQCHPMTGYRTVIESLIALHEVPSDRFRDDRAIGLPAHRVTPRLAETVVAEIGAERGLKIGPIEGCFRCPHSGDRGWQGGRCRRRARHGPRPATTAAAAADRGAVSRGFRETLSQSAPYCALQPPSNAALAAASSSRFSWLPTFG